MKRTYNDHGRTVRVVDLFTAVRFMAGKTLAPGSLTGGSQTQSVRFTDGSIVMAMSECSGPFSDATPDLEFDPPTFHIHDPAWDKG